MILKKDSLKMKAFIETGHQEGKQNTWCSIKTLCTSMSCLEYCLLSNPMFCSKPMSSSVTNILVHALSLPPMQRLNVRSRPLGPFEQFLIRAVIKVNSLVSPLVTKPSGSGDRAHGNAVCSSTDLRGLLTLNVSIVVDILKLQSFVYLMPKLSIVLGITRKKNYQFLLFFSKCKT